jgi:ABC-type oligopeptide transport system ATPase subunit
LELSAPQVSNHWNWGDAMLIELRDIRKIYQLGEVSVPALDGVNISIDRGDFVAIMGSSFSAASTSRRAAPISSKTKM